MANPTTTSRTQTLAAELRDLRARLRAGGGPDKTQKQHEQGKLTARERIAISCARRIFVIVSGHHEPAFTVASFATTITSRAWM